MLGLFVKLKGEGTDPKYCCSSCALLLNEPRQTSCGHRYCRSCLEDLDRRAGGGDCMCKVLSCGEKIKVEEVFPDKAIEKEMRRIGVVCKHGDHGCKWEGLLMDLKDHRDECLYEIVTCINKGCKEKIPRGNLAEHLSKSCAFRGETCPWCKRTYPVKDSVVHKDSCGFAPAKCGWCGKKDLKSEVQRHQHPDTGDCPNMKIPCIFAPVGCTEMIERRHQEDHHQEFLMVHQTMVVTKIQHQRQETESFRNMEAQFPLLQQRIQEIEANFPRLTHMDAASACQETTTSLPSSFPTDVAEQLLSSQVQNNDNPDEGQQVSLPATDADGNVMQRPEQQDDTDQSGPAPTAALHATSGAPVEQETTDPEILHGRIIELEKEVAILKNLVCVLLQDRETLSLTR